MKVLFVCSGNSKNFTLSPFIEAQADALIAANIAIDYSLVIGKGIWGYLKHFVALRKLLRHNEYDVVHAHYSLCGMVASLASCKVMGLKRNEVPVVVSLMGSDVKNSGWWLRVIRFFARRVWEATIVKSQDMKQSLGLETPIIIPNGVDLGIFQHLPKNECRQKLGWDFVGSMILFGADPSRNVKNYPLAEVACSQLKTDNCQLMTLGRISHNNVPLYLNACDVLLLTSKWEGSPNIVKEAMACGTPVVATDVGDVRWLLEGLEGCYVSSHDPTDVSTQLQNALHHQKKTRGRERLIKLGLDSETVAKRIIAVYERVAR